LESFGNGGLLAVIGRVLTTPTFPLGVVGMGVAFYSLLFGLSWGNLSLVVPASASLTFVPTRSPPVFFYTNAWAAADDCSVPGGCGVVLMAI